MSDQDCVVFLQWALPQLHLRWRGFRRVRGQVCKRIQRRMTELGLSSFGEYREHLQHTADEWAVLDAFCRITISRFYRDRFLFDHLRKELLPQLCGALADRGEELLLTWCMGAASGEEPYTLAMIWDAELSQNHPGLAFELIAFDGNGKMLERMDQARYPGSSLRDLPTAWKERYFRAVDQREFQLSPQIKEQVSCRQLDLRHALPIASPQLILCRNLAFTYFDEALQYTTAGALAERLAPGGYLIIGNHEEIPSVEKLPLAQTRHPLIYKKQSY